MKSFCRNIDSSKLKISKPHHNAQNAENLAGFNKNGVYQYLLYIVRICLDCNGMLLRWKTETLDLGNSSPFHLRRASMVYKPTTQAM